MKSARSLLTFFASLFLAFSAAFLGSYFTFGAISGWYAELVKPFLNPPNWIFAPVWTVLYTLMAVAAWRVWEKRSDSPKVVSILILYVVHLAVNALWSIVFFGLQKPALALGIIGVLLAMIFILMRSFYRIDKTAGYLFAPYFAWVLFATYLNASIFLLN